MRHHIDPSGQIATEFKNEKQALKRYRYEQRMQSLNPDASHPEHAYHQTNNLDISTNVRPVKNLPEKNFITLLSHFKESVAYAAVFAVSYCVSAALDLTGYRNVALCMLDFFVYWLQRFCADNYV